MKYKPKNVLLLCVFKDEYDILCNYLLCCTEIEEVVG